MIEIIGGREDPGMSRVAALERMTLKERLKVVGVAGGFFAVGTSLAAMAGSFERGTASVGVLACLAVLVSLASVAFVALAQGLLGKRTAITGWVLDQLVARGEVLEAHSGAIPHGFPHLATIRQSIHALYGHLSGPTVRRFSGALPPGIANLPPDEDPILAVQRLAGTIARHLGLPSGQIVVNFDASLRNPGRVELSRDEVYLIALQARYRHEQQQDIAAILAHELTHIFLFRSGLAFPSTLENEILTDVAAVYLGVGWLVLNAYRRTLTIVGKEGWWIRTRSLEEKLGYLTPEEFGYVLAKRSLAFDDSPHPLLTSLAAREAFRAGSRPALAEYKTPPLLDAGPLRRARYARRSRRPAIPGVVEADRSYGDYRFEEGETPKVVFSCPVCGQRLRLPVGQGRLSAHCQVCGSELDCHT